MLGTALLLTCNADPHFSSIHHVYARATVHVCLSVPGDGCMNIQEEAGSHSQGFSLIALQKPPYSGVQ